MGILTIPPIKTDQEWTVFSRVINLAGFLSAALSNFSGTNTLNFITLQKTTDTNTKVVYEVIAEWCASGARVLATYAHIKANAFTVPPATITSSTDTSGGCSSPDSRFKNSRQFEFLAYVFAKSHEPGNAFETLMDQIKKSDLVDLAGANAGDDYEITFTYEPNSGAANFDKIASAEWNGSTFINGAVA